MALSRDLEEEKGDYWCLSLRGDRKRPTYPCKNAQGRETGTDKDIMRMTKQKPFAEGEAECPGRDGSC